jgi:hypothetical protein
MMIPTKNDKNQVFTHVQSKTSIKNDQRHREVTDIQNIEKYDYKTGSGYHCLSICLDSE